MKVEVKEINDVQRELKFEISSERVAKGFDEVYKDISKKANIKGFRPGKAPRKLLEKNYAGTARSELFEKLIPAVYQEGIEQEKIEPISMPEINDVDFKDNKITFKAAVDIKPEIKIEGYKGIKVTRKDTKVTDKEINKTLEYFQKGQGQEGEDVKKIDDNFAKSMGYPSLEEFKKSLAKQLEVDKDRQTRADVESQIAEALCKKVNFTVPPSLVKREMEHRLKHQQDQWRRQGMSEDEIGKKEESFQKEMQKPTEHQVKTFLILNEIVTLEKLALKEKDNIYFKAMEFLLKEAKWEEKK